MILNYEILTDISVNSLMDLGKLKQFEEESNLKINISALSRKFGVDRRTIRKYVDGYMKPTTRSRQTQFDDYYETINELLSNELKVFAYKSILWRYLVTNYGLKAPESSFRRYIRSVPEFNDYFIRLRQKSTKEPTPMRFESGIAEQAQLDWKESMTLVLSSGESIVVNIFVLLLSYSRFRVYRLSLQKTQDILLNFMSDAFVTFGGVPKEVIVDNMKTVMDESRTTYKPGKVNIRFQQFADDYGFKVKPCIGGRPETKAKVESPMRILDELRAYNGDLTYSELNDKLQEINNRENSRFHNSYQMVPVLGLDKEKDALAPLPADAIRRQYVIKTSKVTVNKSSMITVKSRQYSVSPKYIGKHVTVQCFDNQLHVHYNTQLIAIHNQSDTPLNYLDKHYIEIAKMTLPFDDRKIEEIAKDNLKKIGARYE
ncbi:MAG: IS21 family transposase [Erysipelothrix sp.]|nr:IS21 family transposase [Erysipelothrix sp.]